MIERPDIEQIKDQILKNYPNVEFTIGDVYYDFYERFSKSLFGTIRNAVVKLSQKGFLDYRITIHGVPRIASEKKIKGAVYKIRKRDARSDS